LLKHPYVRIGYVSANNTQGAVSDIWPKLKNKTKLTCKKYDETIALKQAELFFLALPHAISMSIAPRLLKAGKKVIDLSGDYRLATAKDYKRYYKADHQDAENLKTAVYGLPEFHREEIKKAQLIANPGCYPTAGLLALAPVASSYTQWIDSIAIDAKSGVSGAGRKKAESLSFSELTQNFKAYKVLNHQHTPEIERYLAKLVQKKLTIDFVPHLLPVKDGILETIYVRLKSRVNLNNLHKLYSRFYKTEKFVRVLDKGEQAELKNVVGTNYCDISLAVSPSGKLAVITVAIDNLIKGASGQAIQNMNLMCGFKETEGLP